MSASAISLEDRSGAAAVWLRDAAIGLLAAAALLAIYFAALTLVSGWAFTLEQFRQYGGYVVALALGFGVQVTLFLRLRAVVMRAKQAGTLLAASGTTSTAAMVSCCAHYLVNVAPVLGATGLVAFAAHFQVQLFWAGLLFNLAGIAFVGNRLVHARKEHAKCLA